MLLCDPAVNNKASAKSDRNNASELNDSSMVGNRNRQNLDLRFYDRKEYGTLSIDDRKKLRNWRAPNPKEFGQSMKRVLSALKDNKSKRHKKRSLEKI